LWTRKQGKTSNNEENTIEALIDSFGIQGIQIPHKRNRENRGKMVLVSLLIHMALNSK